MKNQIFGKIAKAGVKDVKHLLVLHPDDGSIVAKIFCDGLIKFEKAVYSHQLERINEIKNNFDIIFDSVNYINKTEVKILLVDDDRGEYKVLDINPQRERFYADVFDNVEDAFSFCEEKNLYVVNEYEF